LLIQMRTEKIGLRDHLWRRKVPEFDDPGCDCGEGRQTVNHVLLDVEIIGTYDGGSLASKDEWTKGNLKRAKISHKSHSIHGRDAPPWAV
jgi:hypothetical protein